MNPLASNPIRHLPIGLFLLAILAYGGGFAWYLLAPLNLLELLNWQYDDAFYYLQIAKNLAAGKFSTFDGGITRTNGYHPLWLLLITPFYWVFDPNAALFAIKALEIMLIAGGVALLALAARLFRLPWILLVAVLPVLYQQRGMLVGLEAAAALMMLGALFLALSLFAREPARWAWLLAAVGFALPWVRLEFAIIALTVAVVPGLLAWSAGRASAPSGSLGALSRSRNALPLLGVGAGLVLYFAYHKLVFDGMVPVSGATKAWLAQLQWDQERGYDLVRRVRQILRHPLFRYEVLIAAEVFVYLALVWWFARRSPKRDDWLLVVFLVGVFGLAAEHVAKFAWMLAMNPRGSYMASWYFVPTYLMVALIVPVRCCVAVYFIRRLLRARSPRAAHALALGVVIAGASLLLARTDFLQPFRAVDQARAQPHRPPVIRFAITRLMNRVLPEGSVIGAWDCGVMGYFSRFPVVNLEGLVSDYNYLRAQRAFVRRENLVWQTFAHRWFPAIHQGYGITHLLGNFSKGMEPRVLFEGLPFNYTTTAKIKYPVSAVVPLDTGHAAWFWERLAPHFHYRRANIGVIVDHGLAQVFIKDCDPGRLENTTAAFTWKANGARDSARYPWLNLSRNRFGYCLTAFTLPRDAAAIELALLPANAPPQRSPARTPGG